MLDDSAETPSIEQLVDGSVATVAQMPAAAFSLADMLVSLCGQDSGKNKQQVFKGLVQHLTRHGSAQVHPSFPRACTLRPPTQPPVCTHEHNISHNVKLCPFSTVELQVHYISMRLAPQLASYQQVVYTAVTAEDTSQIFWQNMWSMRVLYRML